jgi:hypothetical protein
MKKAAFASFGLSRRTAPYPKFSQQTGFAAFPYLLSILFIPLLYFHLQKFKGEESQT